MCSLLPWCMSLLLCIPHNKLLTLLPFCHGFFIEQVKLLSLIHYIDDKIIIRHLHTLLFLLFSCQFNLFEVWWKDLRLLPHDEYLFFELNFSFFLAFLFLWVEVDISLNFDRSEYPMYSSLSAAWWAWENWFPLIIISHVLSIFFHFFS